LDTAAIVNKTHPNVEFNVYGDGDLRDELMAKAETLGLDVKSIFKGVFTNREELTRIMAGTDIFLLSSILEGQPLVIVEAMAYGCPIVSTNVGGIHELITDGVNGFLCPPENPQCLADKIRMLLDDLALRQNLSKSARSSYEQSKFGATASAQFFSSVYGEVFEERKRLNGVKQ
jgi:glycosyltransferase involved in cell wall biosynthesis